MTLENKLGITSSAELATQEERLSKKRALKLFESGMLDKLEAGTFKTLQAIHKQLFMDIYDFAGNVRSVNIAKGGFRFVPAMYLLDALKQIERMPQSTFDEIIEKYVEMNLILKKELQLVVDWSKVNKEDYLSAMERSPIKDLEIKFLLKNALTEHIDDREVYMNGIDASYMYEGYEEFKTKDL